MHGNRAGGGQAPPLGRAPEKEVARCARTFQVLPFFRRFLDSFPGMVLVLNRTRQIVFANQAVLDALGVEEKGLLGLRPGEALDCLHAEETPGGCGTSRFCRTCGAFRAIQKSLGGEEWSEECRVLRKPGRSPLAFNFRVWGKPFVWEGQVFSVFSLLDMGEEFQRKNLERVFFHDLLNLASGIRAWVELLDLEELAPGEAGEVVRNLQEATKALVREIEAQKSLVLAERGKWVPRMEEVDARALLETVRVQVEKLDLARGKTLALDVGPGKIRLFSDPSLVSRVLVNLVRNALEAVDPGERVTLGCRGGEEGVRFWVHNPGVIPEEVQLQIFQRFFSTKGPGRGLGTYSVKFFTERYLRGKVSFRSRSPEGTTFEVHLPWRPGRDK